MANIPDNVVVEGRWGTIKYAIRRNGKMPAKEFTESLTVKERLGLEARFDLMADEGTIKNKQQFKKLEGKIHQFRYKQLRVLCFSVKNNWFLTHGFVKKEMKTRRRQIQKAKEIMEEHLETTKGKED